MWTHFPFEESLTANWQRAGAEEEAGRSHSSSFLLHLKINNNQKHTWLSFALSAQLIPGSDSWSFDERFLLKLPCYGVQVIFFKYNYD